MSEIKNQAVRICEKMDKIGRKLLIMSGKGGVGKTSVTIGLANALINAGFSVGILDTDIHGPNVARMLGCENEILSSNGTVIEPVYMQNGLKVMSISFALENAQDAIIFRGPMKLSLIKQFLSDVNWGNLDYLLIDTPPGTGDEQLAVTQNVPALGGCIIVTTAQDVSVLDSSRSISFSRQLKLDILGVIENMSSFVCPHCNKEISIFGTDGAQKLCEQENLPLLGKIPLCTGGILDNSCFVTLAEKIHSLTKPLKSSDIGYVPQDETCSPSSCENCSSDCPSNKGKR